MEIPKTDTTSYIPKHMAQTNVEPDNKAMAKYKPQHLKKPSKKHDKDIYNKTVIRKLGFVDDYARILNPFLLMSKNPIVRNIAPITYAVSGFYMAADVVDKYNKGEDGTGAKPSVKMGVREALYQTATSILAPIGIAKGVQKGVTKLIDGSKLANTIKKGTKAASGFIENNGIAKSALKYASAPAKVLGALAAIFAISKLSKPIDWAVDKLFKMTVDPVLKIGKTDKADKK